MKTRSLILNIVFALCASPLAYGQLDTAIYVQSRDSLILEPPPPLNLTHVNKAAAGEDRVVHWVHGLAGTADSWKPVGPITTNQTTANQIHNYPPRKIWSEFPIYSEVSMQSAVNDLHAQIEASNLDTSHYQLKKDNFIIAHSQGGVVSRGVDRAEDIDPFWRREFGGLVTFGSPHSGAQILNNGLPSEMGGNNMIPDLAEEACRKLSYGPGLAILHQFSWPITALSDALGLDRSLIGAVDTACEIFGQDVIPIFLSSLTPTITQEYMVGTPFMDSINNFTNNQPKVAFYGAEEEPVFWRVANNLKKGPEKFPAFQADDDSSQINYKKTRARYYVEVLTNKSAYDFHKRRATFSIKATFNAYRYSKVYAGYKAGLDFLDKVNDKWKVIIGAQDSVVAIKNGYTCSCVNSGTSPSSYTVQNASDCFQQNPGGDCVTFPNYTITSYQRENDGVVLASSAKAMPGAISFGDERTKMEKTNHFQMRNNKETERVLNGLFIGDFGFYFITPEK